MPRSSSVGRPKLDPATERRRLWTATARQHLLPFICGFDPRYDPSGLHYFLCELAEKIVSGKHGKRFIVNVPPRHGKSRIFSQELPAWHLGRNPDAKIILSSYNQSRPKRDSKYIRRRTEERAYGQLFPKLALREDEGGAGQWATTQDGGVQAVGVGVGIAGFGADLFIIDDPIKDRKEAESEVTRDNIWDWYTSSALQRLSPNGIMLIIMTRWHTDDLVGRLTAKKYKEELADAGFHDENYELINLPGLCKNPAGDQLFRQEGEALWPERWNERLLRAKKLTSTSYEYSAQFDGDPRPRGANSEMTAKIEWIDEKDVPASLDQIRTWDLAATDNANSDANASARGGFHAGDGYFYITHVTQRFQRWLATKKQIGELGDRDGGRIVVEAVGLANGLLDEVRSERMGKNLVEMNTPSASKESRAWPWLSHMELGKVRIVKNPLWNNALIDEINQFPLGAHDDMVDAVSALWEFSGKRKRLLVA